MSGQEQQPTAAMFAAMMHEMRTEIRTLGEQLAAYRESPPMPPALLAALWAPAGSDPVPVSVIAHGRPLTLLVTGGNPDPGVWLAVLALTASGPPSHATLHAALPAGIAAIIDGGALTVSTSARKSDVKAARVFAAKACGLTAGAAGALALLRATLTRAKLTSSGSIAAVGLAALTVGGVAAVGHMNPGRPAVTLAPAAGAPRQTAPLRAQGAAGTRAGHAVSRAAGAVPTHYHPGTAPAPSPSQPGGLVPSLLGPSPAVTVPVLPLPLPIPSPVGSGGGTRNLVRHVLHSLTGEAGQALSDGQGAARQVTGQVGNAVGGLGHKLGLPGGL